MIRIFPDFSVQVTASAGAGPGAGGGGGGGGGVVGGGMVTGPPVGRVPVQVPGATNGTPQSVQGISGYQQRYVSQQGDLWSGRDGGTSEEGVGRKRGFMTVRKVNQLQQFCLLKVEKFTPG